MRSALRVRAADHGTGDAAPVRVAPALAGEAEGDVVVQVRGHAVTIHPAPRRAQTPQGGVHPSGGWSRWHPPPLGAGAGVGSGPAPTPQPRGRATAAATAHSAGP